MHFVVLYKNKYRKNNYRKTIERRIGTSDIIVDFSNNSADGFSRAESRDSAGNFPLLMKSFINL